MGNSVTAPKRSRRVRYRSRRSPASFLFSAAFHGTILGFVALGPRPTALSRRPNYETFIRPNEKKIIWYRKLPQIAPRVKIGDSPDPHGAIKSPSTLIAAS